MLEEEVKPGTLREGIHLSVTYAIFLSLLTINLERSLKEMGMMFESEGVFWGEEGKELFSFFMWMQSESLHSYPPWINSLYSESACLFRLEGLTCQCCHEQKLSIMNSQLQVTHALEIQLAKKHVEEEMAFLNDVKGDHRKNCIWHVVVQYNRGRTV